MPKKEIEGWDDFVVKKDRSYTTFIARHPLRLIKVKRGREVR